MMLTAVRYGTACLLNSLAARGLSFPYSLVFSNPVDKVA
jgi:hypothetical protein